MVCTCRCGPKSKTVRCSTMTTVAPRVYVFIKSTLSAGISLWSLRKPSSVISTRTRISSHHGAKPSKNKNCRRSSTSSTRRMLKMFENLRLRRLDRTWLTLCLHRRWWIYSPRPHPSHYIFPRVSIVSRRRAFTVREVKSRWKDCLNVVSWSSSTAFGDGPLAGTFNLGRYCSNVSYLRCRKLHPGLLSS